MFPHVNKREGDLRSIESSLNNGVWIPNKCEDCPVGGLARINIQQDGSRGGTDCTSDGINDLFNITVTIITGHVIKKTFLSLPSEKFGTHSIIFDIVAPFHTVELILISTSVPVLLIVWVFS